ncbi:alpha/beta fold hydrolase [Micromonospora chaiyaphumensis]|nr:alpha/beta hydrolase [Micromonospora chaiyaphumensis]
MTTVEADGVTLGVEHFGDAAAPLVLLAGGTTMLSWPDALCQALARGGRHVVRYDLRDSGVSTTVDPEAPSYTLRDLAADSAALARELDHRPAHLAGIGVGGMVAQVAALDHPDAFSALTLVGTRPVAPGPVDGDLPDHDTATMGRLFSRAMPDWSDRAAVAEFAAAGAEILNDDPVAAHATAAQMGPHAEHGARGADGQPSGHGVRQARLHTALARAPVRARDPDAGGARSPRPVLPCRQRRSARARDPWCAAARAPTGRDGDPRAAADEVAAAMLALQV